MTVCKFNNGFVLSPLTALEAYGLAVPEIMPLETLHNSLTLAHFDKFLTNIIEMGTLSPKRSYPAMPVSLVGSLGKSSTIINHTNANGSNYKLAVTV